MRFHIPLLASPKKQAPPGAAEMPVDSASGASKVVDCTMTSFCKSPTSPYSMRSKSYGSDLDLLSLGATQTDVEITTDAEDSDAYLDDSTSVAESRPSVDLVDQLAGLMAGLAEQETDADEEEDAPLATKSPYLSESESEVVVPLNAEEQLSFGIANETAGTRGTDSQLPLAADKFVVLRVIGHGLHGHVRVVQDRQTSKLYALKVIPKLWINAEDRERQLMNEYKALQKLASPFCVKLHAALQNSDALFFLMDYVGGGDLYFHLDKYGSFDEGHARFYVACTLLALEHVHSLGMVYRDVKPENLVLDDKGYLRMIDFGFAKSLEAGKAYTACGTPDYQAPEVITGAGAGKEADYWSVGVLLYELLSGYTPFAHMTGNPRDIFQNILSGKYYMPPLLPTAAANLIMALLKANPARRLGSGPGGIQEIMSHAFFDGFDWDALRKQEMACPIVPKERKVKTAEYFKPCHERGVPRYAATSSSAIWDDWDWSDIRLPQVDPAAGPGPRVVTL